MIVSSKTKNKFVCTFERLLNISLSASFYLLSAFIVSLFLGPLLTPATVNNRLHTLSKYGDKLAAIEHEKAAETPHNALLIKDLGVDLEIYSSNDSSNLDKGVWQRYASRSSPLMGGNLILTAHRISLGNLSSPLFYAHKLEIGDEVNIFWEGKLYSYIIQEKFRVGPNDVFIEDDTDHHQLTLYTCLLTGSESGRLVFIAKPNSDYG